MIDIKYIPFEIAAWLKDPDVVAQSPAWLGVYFKLTLYMYAEGGRIRWDSKKLARLCNCSERLLIRVQLLKFQVRRGFIYHKRVTKEVNAAQVRHDKALIASRERWSKHKPSIAQSDRGHSQYEDEDEGEGESEYKGASRSIFDSDSDSFPLQAAFVGGVANALGARGKNDIISFKNLYQAMRKCWRDGERDVWDRLRAYTTEAQKCDPKYKKVAIFWATVKKEFGYVPPSNRKRRQR